MLKYTTKHRGMLLLTLLGGITTSAFAKPPIMTPATTPMLGEVDPYLIQNIYNSKNPDASLADVRTQIASARPTRQAKNERNRTSPYKTVLADAHFFSHLLDLASARVL